MINTSIHYVLPPLSTEPRNCCVPKYFSTHWTVPRLIYIIMDDKIQILTSLTFVWWRREPQDTMRLLITCSSFRIKKSEGTRSRASTRVILLPKKSGGIMSYVPVNFEHHTKMETNSASIWNVWGIAPTFKCWGGGTSFANPPYFWQSAIWTWKQKMCSKLRYLSLHPHLLSSPGAPANFSRSMLPTVFPPTFRSSPTSMNVGYVYYTSSLGLSDVYFL